MAKPYAVGLLSVMAAATDLISLIKGSKTLNDIDNSPHGNNVFEIIEKREDEKQSEIAQKPAMINQAMINQIKSLHEAGIIQIVRNQQPVNMQEEQNQAHRRRTEREMAEIERETIIIRAMTEAEARAHEAKLAEDVNRRMLIDRANKEREECVAARHATFLLGA